MQVDINRTYSVNSTCRTGIQRCIECWLAMEDKYRSFNSEKHISLNEAYEQILHELSIMDDRFYDYIDQQHLQRSITNEDKLTFVIPELMNMLHVIYKTPNYASITSEEFVTDDGYEKSSSDFQSYWKNSQKLRKRCANLIWKLWHCERLQSYRCGLIHLFIAETSVPKVLLIAYIRKGVYCYGYPKGKCNIGETKIMTMFREFTEEINKDTFDFFTYNDEDDMEFIKKSPFMGRRCEGRSQDHYYAMIKSSVEYTDYGRQRAEILNVEWFPVLRFPCFRNCRICPRRKLIGDSEEGLPINYHMVTLRDIHNRNPAIIDLLRYIASHGDSRIVSSYFHAHRRCEHDLA